MTHKKWNTKEKMGFTRPRPDSGVKKQEDEQYEREKWVLLDQVVAILATAG